VSPARPRANSPSERASKEASTHAGRQAGKQASKQASRQASKQGTKQASKQAGRQAGRPVLPVKDLQALQSITARQQQYLCAMTCIQVSKNHAKHCQKNSLHVCIHPICNQIP